MKGVDILMSNSEYNKDQLIEHLYAVMNAETEKPYEEMDADLVEACTELILELQGKNFTLSNEEIEEQVRKIPFVEVADFKATNKNKRKKINKKKLLLIAAIVTILCALLMVFAAGNRYRTTYGDMYPITDILKQMFGSIANVPKNKSIYIDDNIEVIISDAGKLYDSRDEFFENEDYSVLIPSALPDDINIVNISVESSGDITVTFDSVVTSYKIETDTEIPQALYKKIKEPVTTENNIVCYIEYIEATDAFQIHFNYNGDYYYICGTDKQILLNIINNLEEYK